MSTSAEPLEQERPRTLPPIPWVQYAIPVGIGLLIWFLPHPAAVSQIAWHMLAIFVATIVAIITRPLPMGAVTLIGLLVCILTDTVPLVAVVDPETGKAGPTALMGFSNTTIWLIVMAFMISAGFQKTGLGRRIALWFVSKVGKKMLGVSYGLALADLVMAPAIPSATARGGGIMAPIMKSVAETYDSKPGPTARRAGAFLSINVGQVNAITRAMFVTAMAGNPLIVSLASDQGVELSWLKWAAAAIVPGLVALLVVPWVVYMVYPPELKDTPEIVEMAKDELRVLGPLTGAEKMMTFTFVLLLFFWTVGDIVMDISATTTGIIGLVVLLISGVLTWQDVLDQKAGWDTMVWFAVLFMMASALNTYGLITWASGKVASSLGDYSWPVALLILILVYFFSHYLFASATAHISAMYPAFLAAAIALGAPPVMSALVFGYLSNLFTSLTQYAGGASPALFGTGYNTTGQWWRTSAIAGLASLTIWIVVGGSWMKLIGFW
ncbi:MAG: anion permease [Thermomicrobiales bacterium]|nr:anion permease [Thermomicrobiales bacterium]